MFSLVCFTESNSVHSNWSDTPCEEMRSVKNKKIPMEEETEEQFELFSNLMQMIVNKWDPYINNLKKKSLPLHPNELMEVKKAKNDQH